MQTVSISPQALTDLAEIDDYITYELLNPPAAEHLIEKLKGVISDLAFSPERGSRYKYTEMMFSTAISFLEIIFFFYHILSEVIYADRVIHSKTKYLQDLLGPGFFVQKEIVPYNAK